MDCNDPIPQALTPSQIKELKALQMEALKQLADRMDNEELPEKKVYKGSKETVARVPPALLDEEMFGTFEEFQEGYQKLKDIGVQDAIMGEIQYTTSRRKLLRALLKEKLYRRMRAINLYRPLPKQLRFHKSIAPERLALGGNRSGKTTCCAVEVAWAATGTHPYWKRYPKQDGNILCVAKNLIKIGEVIFVKLFKSAFELVRDPQTGILRTWDPDNDGFDIERIPSLPLLDERNIKHIAWERRAISVPKKVVMKNGYELTFWSADGKPPNGMAADMVWFDEEVESREWYTEMAARLPTRNGRFIWSATPQAASQLLWELHEKAEKDVGAARPRVEEFHFIFDDSPFIDKEAREDFKEKMLRDTDDYKVRVMGEFLIKSHRVYPDFRTTLHGCDWFEVPSDWTRYIVIDPGYANSFALFLAVPPTDHELAGHVFVYDELYCKQDNVKSFAEQVERKARNQSFQAFIIDDHGARRTESNGKTIGLQYSEQFKRVGLRSVETGHAFHAIGTDSVKFGTKTLKDEISQVRAWLWPNAALNDKPILQVMSSAAENFIEQMKNYSNKTVDGKATDEPDSRRWSHGPDCLRYAVLHGVPFVEPMPIRKMSAAYRRFLAERRKKRKGNFILFGE